LYAGVKFAVLFDVTREKKPPVPPQTFPFYARVVDDVTNENLDAEVTLRFTQGNRLIFTQRTDANGIVAHQDELRKGRYNVSATADGYINFRKAISHSRLDTILIPMTRIPNFNVRVIDAKTRENIVAEILVSTAADNREMFRIQTNPATGLASYTLSAGRYVLRVSAEDYYTHQETINHSNEATLEIALTPVEKAVEIVLHNLFFATNEAAIMPESEPALEQLYQTLVLNPELRIKIIGHTDNVGSRPFNQTLSENRAKSVYEAMIQKGIDASRMNYEGRGMDEPVASNDTEEGRAQNRRVVFIIQ
jgi:outer membrane protein OmpA-like peptidoglycan-associated protein